MTPMPHFTGSEPCTKRPDLFLGDDNDKHTVAAAKAHCMSCPLIQQCADWAIAHEKHLVWGSLSPEDRDKIRKARGIVVDQPSTSLPRHEAIPHGTEAGYKQHQRRGIPVNAFDSCGCRRAQWTARAERLARSERAS